MTTALIQVVSGLVRSSTHGFLRPGNDPSIPNLLLEDPPASGVTGTSATTNANDTSAASGSPVIVGTSATTNAADTSSASGTTTVVGSAAATNANDTSSASGTVGGGSVTGTSDTTNANDAASASGTTTVVGTSATTNANDTAAASGWAGIVSGTSATTNANDIAAASGVSGDGSSIHGRVVGRGRIKLRKPKPEPPAIVDAPVSRPAKTESLVDALAVKSMVAVAEYQLKKKVARRAEIERKDEEVIEKVLAEWF